MFLYSALRSRLSFKPNKFPLIPHSGEKIGIVAEKSDIFVLNSNVKDPLFQILPLVGRFDLFRLVRLLDYNRNILVT